jgi:hypothetical protein
LDVNRVRSPNVTEVMVMSFAAAVSAIEVPERVCAHGDVPPPRCASPRQCLGIVARAANTPVLTSILGAVALRMTMIEQPIREPARIDAGTCAMTFVAHSVNTSAHQRQ